MDWTPYRKFDVPTVILMCVVIQGLDTSNWRWVGSEHIRMNAMLPCTSIQTAKCQWIRVTNGNERKKRYTAATIMPTKIAPYLWRKGYSKSIDCRKRSTLTWYPVVPTLQKEWGKRRMNYLCSFKFNFKYLYSSCSRSSQSNVHRTWETPAHRL